MSMRNTLLAAAGFIVLMVVVLIFFGKGEEHGMLLSPQASEGEAKQSIKAARQAFWDRDLPKAERLYRILTRAEDANIDAWGELGNLYYMQARWQEAAKAYTEVALRLIDKNELQQAAFFHRLVSRMDQEQSARINQRLQTLNNKQETNS